MGELIVFIIPVGLLAFTYFWGTALEKKHLKELRQRETDLSQVSWSSLGKKEDFSQRSLKGELFIGQVVIGQDYFRSFVAGLIGLVGGTVTVYESLLDRGRREALCRLREASQKAGYTSIVNVRFVSSTVGVNKHDQASGIIEILAYGTGVKDSEEKHV